MNKFFIFLAFAVFTLIACSEEKPEPSHSELCSEKTITKDCLVGKWRIEKVEGTPTCTPNPNQPGLKFEANGKFSFKGGYINDINPNTNGTWVLDEKGTTMEISVKGDYIYDLSATIEILNTGNELRITSSTNRSSFLQCGEGNFTEVFSWQGY